MDQWTYGEGWYYFEFLFIFPHEILYHIYILKSAKISKQRTNWRFFILAQTWCTPQISHVDWSCRWIKVIVVMNMYKPSERILCTWTMFELQLKKIFGAIPLKAVFIWGNNCWAKPCPRFLTKCVVFMLWKIFYF